MRMDANDTGSATATVIVLQSAIFAFPQLVRVLALVRPAGADFVAVAAALTVPVLVVEVWKFGIRTRRQSERVTFVTPSLVRRHRPAS